MEIGDCTVLVIKDWDTTLQTTIREMLEYIGFDGLNIYLPDSLEEAKRIIKKGKIDLVLSALGIKDEIGPELITWTKDVGVRKKLIFVFYSGGGEHYVKQKVIEYGADDYVSTPVIGINVFAKKIKALIA